MSGKCSKINDSILQKMVRMQRMLEKEKFTGLVLLFFCFVFFKLPSFSLFISFSNDKIVKTAKAKNNNGCVSSRIGVEYTIM